MPQLQEQDRAVRRRGLCSTSSWILDGFDAGLELRGLPRNIKSTRQQQPLKTHPSLRIRSSVTL